MTAMKVKAYIIRADVREGRNRPHLALTFKEFGGTGRQWVGYITPTVMLGTEQLADLGVFLDRDKTYTHKEVIALIEKQYGRLLDVTLVPRGYGSTTYAAVDHWRLCVNKSTWNQKEQMLAGGNCV